MVQLQVPAPKKQEAAGSFYDLYKQVAGPMLKALGSVE